MATAQAPILFFDGGCLLCNRFVRAIQRMDRSHRLQFAPIESTPGQAVMQNVGLKVTDSAFILERDEWGQEHIATKSKMLLRTARYLGWPGTVIGTMLTLIPEALADRAYDFVAKHRTKWPDKACPLPSHERERLFLD